QAMQSPCHLPHTPLSTKETWPLPAKEIASDAALPCTARPVVRLSGGQNLRRKLSSKKPSVREEKRPGRCVLYSEHRGRCSMPARHEGMGEQPRPADRGDPEPLYPEERADVRVPLRRPAAERRRAGAAPEPVRAGRRPRAVRARAPQGRRAA